MLSSATRAWRTHHDPETNHFRTSRHSLATVCFLCSFLHDSSLCNISDTSFWFGPGRSAATCEYPRVWTLLASCLWWFLLRAERSDTFSRLIPCLRPLARCRGGASNLTSRDPANLTPYYLVHEPVDGIPILFNSFPCVFGVCRMTSWTRRTTMLLLSPRPTAARRRGSVATFFLLLLLWGGLRLFSRGGGGGPPGGRDSTGWLLRPNDGGRPCLFACVLEARWWWT